MSVDLEARTARMRQFPPRFKDTVDRIEDLAAAVGLSVEDLHPDLPAQVAWTGIDVLVVPVRDAGAVSRAAPSPAKLTALVGSVGTDGLYLAALDGDGVHARFFTSGAAVYEELGPHARRAGHAQAAGVLRARAAPVEDVAAH